MGRLKDSYWFKASRSDLHDVVFRMLDNMKVDLSDRTERNSLNLSLYQGEAVDLGQTAPAFQVVQRIIRQQMGGSEFPMSLNVVQSCIDTLASKIASTKPRPQFLTNDGEWSLREQAKLLEKLVEGVFYESNLYHEARRAFVDACVFGTGFLKTFEADGRVRIERVFPEEIIVDEKACLTAEPRSIFQRKLVPAEVLMDKFPEAERKIMEAMEATPGNTTYTDAEVIESDMVEVVEGWHNPSSRNAKDGLHALMIAGHTLFQERLKRNHPIIPLRWNRKPVGWFGQGLSEQLRSIQMEINKLVTRIQQAMHYYAVTNTYIRKGSVKKTQLKNSSGNIVEVEQGFEMPVTTSAPPMSSQVFDHLWTLYSKAFEIAGISQMSASSLKPAGVESGVALRTLLDTETQRFGLLARDWEEFFVEAAREVVRCAKDIYERDGEFSTSYVSKDFKREIDFSEVNIDESAYVLKVYPTNFLPQSPAGKLAFVQELMQANMIDQRAALAMLEHPDIERHMTMETAALNEIDRAIELILTDGKIEKPPQYLDKDLAISRVTKAALVAANAGAPRSKIVKLEKWLEMLLNPDTPPKPPLPPQPEGPVGPGGGPGGPLGPEGPLPPPGPQAMPPGGQPIPPGPV